MSISCVDGCTTGGDDNDLKGLTEDSSIESYCKESNDEYDGVYIDFGFDDMPPLERVHGSFLQENIEKFCKSEDLSYMQAMVADGTIEDVNVFYDDKSGERIWTALMLQCRYRKGSGYLERIRFLLGCDPPANPNIQNNEGETSLHYALNLVEDSDHHDLVQLLLENGADRCIKNNQGRTALDKAKIYNFSKSIELLENYHPNMPLHSACFMNKPVDIISSLIASHPEEIRLEIENGKNALHIALERNAHIEVVSLLLSAYSETARKKCNKGDLPLHIALEKNAPIDVVSLLLSAYPDAVREKYSKGNVSLHIALEKSAHIDVVSLLLSAYPEAAREKCIEGKVSLHIALEKSAPVEVVSLLLSAYPDAVREKYSKGNVSLHIALEKSAPVEVVSLLLSAYPEAAREMCGYGNLPLFIALEKSARIEIVSLLLTAYPESIREKYRRGNLPLHIALEKNAPVDIVSMLLTAYPESARKAGCRGKIPLLTSFVNISFDNLVVLLDFTTRGVEPGDVYVIGLPEFLISYGEQHVDAFAAFLDLRALDVPLLANTPDTNGRTALFSAGPKCRALLKQRLYLCDRYELGEQVHSSVTSRVYFAIDHDPAAASTNGFPPRVALKFMRHHEHFKAEIDAREQASSAKASFISVVASFDGDIDATFYAELVARNLESHKYMLVMPAGGRSFEAAIVAESAETNWPIEAKRACRELAEALVSLHSAGFVHGDVKPRNVMRVESHFKLIDFDAAVKIGSPQSGKLSTAYAPPEAYEIVINAIAEGGGGGGGGERGSYSSSSIVRNVANLPASIAADAWSFGATLYRALQNSTFVRVKGDDADGDIELRAIAEWSDATKYSLLSSVPDVIARNLLGQLLHKDPKKRPTISRALQHSFFTGKKAIRLSGDNYYNNSNSNNNIDGNDGDDGVEWDVFISYRVASDANIAEALYTELKRLGLRVFWDKVCLLPGQEWRDGFFDGLVKSRLFLPIISRGAIKTVDLSNNKVWGNWEILTSGSGCDNVLLEHRAALECRDRGLLEAVFPIFVGDETAPGPCKGVRGPYFIGSCAPKPVDVTVLSVEDELRFQLDRAGLGTPYADNVTVRTVFGRITAFQGAFLEDIDVDIAIEAACASIVKALTPALLLVTTSSSSTTAATTSSTNSNISTFPATAITAENSSPSISSISSTSSNSFSIVSSVTFVRTILPDGTVKFVSSTGASFSPKEIGLDI